MSSEAYIFPTEIYFNENNFSAFTNEAAYGIHLEDKTWPTVSHYLLSKQYPMITNYNLWDYPQIKDVHELIKFEKIGQSLKWEMYLEDHLWRALHAKFTQHLELEQMLSDTLFLMLVYDNPQDINHGVGTNKYGSNILGKMLMRTRNSLAISKIEFIYSDSFLLDITTYQSLLILFPENIELLSSLGAAYLVKGKYFRAINIAQKILEIDPYHEQTLYILSIGFYKIANYEKAIAPIKLCTKIDPENIEYYLILSEVYKRLDKRISSILYARKSRLLSE